MSIPTFLPRAARRRLASAFLLGLVLVLLAGAVVEGASVVTHGSRVRSWVALTFDDGWSTSRCASIADTLRRKDATATFFINGSVMRRSPSRWRSILRGFPVANHTYSHRDLRYLSASAIRAEVQGDEQRIEHILGRPMLKLLRPPYGGYDSEVQSVAGALGYRLVLWDVDSFDTRAGATTSSVLAAAIRGGRGAIVLMHCGPSVTPGAVGRVIDAYRARGFAIVDLAQMLGLAPLRPTRPATACRVRNARTGVEHWQLGRAAAKARRGDRLVLSGLCQGSTTIRKDLVIEGTRIRGSGRPTLDGQRKGRVLTVTRGVSVILRALLIERGRDPEGGGIRNAGSLRLRDTVVRDSRAQHAGGIDNRPPGTLRLLGTSVVKGNQAGVDSGGIRNLGTMLGVTCGPGGNVRANLPDDCGPAPSPEPEPEPDPTQPGDGTDPAAPALARQARNGSAGQDDG
jgi:peptidoglycan/xylan/chitin deacetylase (PgdA/CDA1 family)